MPSEAQQEEAEVLFSIYDGDENFKKNSDSSYQYKIKDENEKEFLLEISWPEDYPDVPPVINMDMFFNNKLLPEVKEMVIEELKRESEQWIGSAMTYTLIEYAKENAVRFLEKQVETTTDADVIEIETEKENEIPSSRKEPKQQQLTKNQKRKLAGRVMANGELPRGYNWVDVVKHLCQGPKTAAVS